MVCAGSRSRAVRWRRLGRVATIRPDVPENRTALFTPQHYLRSAMAPRSLAVVGASERSGALGAAVFGNIRAGTFAGPVYPVNPKYRQLDGLGCYARLADLPEAPDLAVVVTPAATVPGLIDAAGDLGIRNVLVLSAGFAESGPEGKALQDDLLARARVRGVRVLGPNCLGLMRPGIGLNASFARTPARPGSVALVSQSGAIVAALLDHAWAAGFGFSSVVSTGAGVDIEFAEILDFLALDADTHSIVLYVEGVHDARGLLSSVRAAASAKPVVVLKVGRHLTGSTAAMSHTGALVGNDAVFDGALRRVGAIRVDAVRPAVRRRADARDRPAAARAAPGDPHQRRRPRRDRRRLGRGRLAARRSTPRHALVADAGAARCLAATHLAARQSRRRDRRCRRAALRAGTRSAPRRSRERRRAAARTARPCGSPHREPRRRSCP